MDSIPNLQAFNSQVPSSHSSFACPSEPLDVGNWFSSYEYRSPDPDSNFGVEDSAFGGNDSQKDEVVAGCVEHDYNHGEDQCFTKNLESPNSCSLLSEPPDIRNWFSSYVYESPLSDTSGLFRDEGNECREERFDSEAVNEDESRSENGHRKGCFEHNSSRVENKKGDDDSAEMKKDLTIADASYSEKILQQCMEDKTVQHNLGPAKYEETLNLNHRSPGRGHVMPLDTDISAMRPPKLSQKNDTREAKSKAEIQNDKLDLRACLAKTFSTNSTCASNKENDGFVTTRKNSGSGAKDEKTWRKPENILLEGSANTGTVPLACEKQAATKRKALSEATNIQQSNAVGITGKWQCPQIRKTNVGPAMKQLRLERWVRRI
ncbi:hypothetical protein RJT34_05513 [Clitoria ternatea]|uniref:Uncharacterized protein n=1 Tax=Clitoria ternatea TaxID=43366 RepID=A0AAN9K1I9_CLITE